MNTEDKPNQDFTPLIGQYLAGFILSLVLTLGSYFLVENKILSGALLVGVIMSFAMVQLVVQMIFFFHLDQEPKPHWNLMMFLSTLGVVFIIAAASLWIMHHLNYNMMPPQEMDQYIFEKEGIHK